jgi:hypothetical protein
MNKEKLIQLREKVHYSFFKKSCPREKLSERKEYRGISL